MKTCTQCGAQMEDDVIFCAACGKSFDMPDRTPVPKKGSARKILIPVICAAGAIVLLATFFAAFCGIRAMTADPWKSGLNNYCRVFYQGKQNMISRLAPTDYWDYMEYETGMDKDEILRLKQITGLAALFRESGFGNAWTPLDGEEPDSAREPTSGDFDNFDDVSDEIYYIR